MAAAVTQDDLTDRLTRGLLPTPLVEIGGCQGCVMGKAEFVLPSGSIKHRSIPPRIAELLRERTIVSGQAIIIHSAGSAAMSTAWAGARLGLKVHAIVPRSVSAAMLAALRWQGACCHAVGSAEAPATIARLQREEGAYLLDQFADPKISMHYAAIADELLEQMDRVDAVVTGIGTGGSICGIARRLRERAPHCRIVGVEPAEAQVSRGQPWAPHEIVGLAPPMRSRLLQPALLDEVAAVSSAEAWIWARRLAQHDGLRVGPSAGAAVAVASRLGLARVVAILGGSIEGLLTEERMARYAVEQTLDEEAS